MSLGSSAPAGASTNMPRAGASVYTPSNQGNVDLALQNIGGTFLNQIGPDFSGTPGAWGYQAGQEWYGPGSITDYTNPYYQAQLGSAGQAQGFASPIMSTAQNVLDTLPTAYGQANTAVQPAIAGLDQAIQYGYGGAIPNAIAQAQALQGYGSQLGGGLGQLLGTTLPQTQQASAGLLDSANWILNNLGPLTAGAGENLLGAGGDILSQTLPQALAASGTTSNVADWLQSNLGPLTAGAGENLISAGSTALNTSMPLAVGGALDLSKYGGDILGTAFDPQQALYDRLQNQNIQQTRAIESQAGLGAGSGIGDSITANALGNFNINWQNQQLARQAQGLQAAEPAFQEAGVLPGQAAAAAVPALQAGAQMPSQFAQSLLPLRQAAAQLPGIAAQSAIAPIQAGTALPGGFLSSLDQPLATGAGLPGGVLQQGGAIGQQIAALNQAAGQLPMNLAGGYGNLGAQAGQLSYAPLQSYGQTAGMVSPLVGQGLQLGGALNAAQNQQTIAALNALAQGVNFGNQKYTLPQQMINNLESYLGLGQSASQLSGQLGQMGQNQLLQSMAGLGGALGTGANLLFGSQPFGSSGLLGNPFSATSGGLLGGSLANLFGGGAAPIQAGVGGAFATAPFTDLLGAGAADAGAAATGGGFLDSLGGLIPFLGA